MYVVGQRRDSYVQTYKSRTFVGVSERFPYFFATPTGNPISRVLDGDNCPGHVGTAPEIITIIIIIIITVARVIMEKKMPPPPPRTGGVPPPPGGLDKVTGTQTPRGLDV